MIKTADPTWLCFELANDVERTHRSFNDDFRFGQVEFFNIGESIRAAGTSSSIERRKIQMNNAAEHFKSLTKEVLVKRCERIVLFMNVLRRVEQRKR